MSHRSRQMAANCLMDRKERVRHKVTASRECMLIVKQRLKVREKTSYFSRCGKTDHRINVSSRALRRILVDSGMW